MLGNKRVIVVDVQLDALLPPAGLLREGQGHQVVPLDAVLHGLEHERGGLVHVGAGRRAAHAADL